MLTEGFYYKLNTKMVSASERFSPLPQPRGSAPWTPEIYLPPLTIYPGAAPAYNTHKDYNHFLHIQLNKSLNKIINTSLDLMIVILVHFQIEVSCPLIDMRTEEYKLDYT